MRLPCPSTVGIQINEQGELMVKGATVFAGYYKNDEATAATIRDGWLYTGDVVAME